MLAFRLGKLELEISIWFAAFFAVLFLDVDRALLGRCLSFMVVHELGHLVPMVLFSNPPKKIGLYLGRIEIEPRFSLGLSRSREAVILIGGIAANLVAAGVVYLAYLKTGGGYDLVAINLTLAAFNALPAGSFDGGRALRLVLEALFEYTLAEKLARSVSFVTAVCMLCFGIIGLARSLANLTFIVLAVYVIVVTLKNSYC